MDELNYKGWEPLGYVPVGTPAVTQLAQASTRAATTTNERRPIFRAFGWEAPGVPAPVVQTRPCHETDFACGPMRWRRAEIRRHSASHHK